MFQTVHADLTSVWWFKNIFVIYGKKKIKPNCIRSVLRLEDVKKVDDALKTPLSLLTLTEVDFGFAFN